MKGDVARQRQATAARWGSKRATLHAAAEVMGVDRGSRWLVTGKAAHVVCCEDAACVTPLTWCKTLLFDPPWDIPVEATPGDWLDRLVFTNGRHLTDALRLFGVSVTWQFVWNCQSVHALQRRPKLAHKSCLWYGSLDRFVASHATRARYGDTVPAHLIDVFSAPLTSLLSAGMHPHEKPLPWVTNLLAHCTHGGVFDPYAGSGTTLLACEHLGRPSMSVEIKPGHVALILWRAMAAGCNIERA